MAAKTHGERIDRLEKVMQVIAEDHIELRKGHVALRKLIAELATETRRGFDRVEKQFDRVQKQFEESDMKARRTDERIDKLVIAMGEFIRRSSR